MYIIEMPKAKQDKIKREITKALKRAGWWIKPRRYEPLRVSDCRVNAREFMRTENGVKMATIANEKVEPNKVTFTFKGWDGYEVIVYRNIFKIIDRW